MRVRVDIAFAIAFTLPMLAGCEKTPRDKLQGRWLGEGIENVPARDVGKATGWVKGTAIEFAGSRVTVTIPAEAPRSGTFKIAKVEGETVTVAFQRDEGGHDEADFRFAPDQSLRWALGNGREIIMVRAKN